MDSRDDNELADCAFDFEEQINGNDNDSANAAQQRNPRKQIVCWRWIENLCMKDADTCNYLHQYDQTRMPVCRFFAKHGVCSNIQDCVYKHATPPQLMPKECFLYKRGFCPNGPHCRYRHVKLPGPPPPVEQVFQQLEAAKKAKSRGATKRHLAPDQLKQSPLPQGSNTYFIVKSNNPENLELSVRRGMWATQPQNEVKLNEAFQSSDNVILIFSVNRTHHFQGCAKMTSKTGAVPSKGPWMDANGRSREFGGNFSLQWLKLCELPFGKTQRLKNPLNENKPVQISRDGQELEASVGEQLASLLFLEQDSELVAIAHKSHQLALEEESLDAEADEENEIEGDDEYISNDQILNANEGEGLAGRGNMFNFPMGWPGYNYGASISGLGGGPGFYNPYFQNYGNYLGMYGINLMGQPSSIQHSNLPVYPRRQLGNQNRNTRRFMPYPPPRARRNNRMREHNQEGDQ